MFADKTHVKAFFLKKRNTYSISAIFFLAEKLLSLTGRSEEEGMMLGSLWFTQKKSDVKNKSIFASVLSHPPLLVIIITPLLHPPPSFYLFCTLSHK